MQNFWFWTISQNETSKIRLCPPEPFGQGFALEIFVL
jgi:hypothetical protein